MISEDRIRGKHICHKKGKTQFSAFLYEHLCHSRKTGGKPEIQVPKTLWIPHSMTYTCTGLYMFVSKSKQWPQLKPLCFSSYHRLIFKSWLFQPFCLSDSFGKCQSLHCATVVFLSGSEQTALWFHMWLGIQMRYRLWEFGGYRLTLETIKYLLYLFPRSSSCCKIFPGILG